MVALLRLIEQRMHAQGVSWQQIASALGVHGINLSRHSIRSQRPHLHFADVPLGIIANLARLLDIPIEAFLPELTPVPHHPNGTPQDPATTNPAPDTLITVAALAHARLPMTTDDLANALQWPHHRLTDAILHLHNNPHMAGPYTLTGTPDGRMTVHLRMDLLTTDQYDALRDAQSAQRGLTVTEAAIVCLLAQTDHPHSPHPDITALTNDHQHTIHQLQRRGIITNISSTNFKRLDDAIRYSLGIKDPQEKRLNTPRWLEPDPNLPEPDDATGEQA